MHRETRFRLRRAKLRLEQHRPQTGEALHSRLLGRLAHQNAALLEFGGMLTRVQRLRIVVENAEIVSDVLPRERFANLGHKERQLACELWPRCRRLRIGVELLANQVVERGDEAAFDQDALGGLALIAPDHLERSLGHDALLHLETYSSRNVPAVSLASKLTQPSLYDFLRNAGVSDLKSESHYGLALALGGGELTMEELVSLYAMLANHGRFSPYHLIKQDSATFPLLSEESAYITLDMLRQNPRPDTGEPDLYKTAWKTGTSWGFHDA